MGFRGQVTGALLAALVIALLVGGCGGSSSDASGAESDKADEVELASPSEGEPSKAFLKSKSKIAKFGEEASAAERKAASTVLEENLKAREVGEWAKQCATLTPGAVKEVEQGAAAQGVKKGSCAEELKGRAEPLQRSKTIRESSMKGPIDALRVKGSQGWALYHGIGGRDFAMQMEKVDGEWRVGALLEQ